MEPIIKKTLLSILLVLVSALVFAQTPYYWYKGKKIYLRNNPGKMYILTENSLKQSTLQHSLGNTGATVERFEQTRISNTLRPFGKQQKDEKQWAIINTNGGSKQHSILGILYQAPFFYTEDNEEVGLSHLFYVKLNQPEDISILQDMAQNHNVDILGSNRFMPLWYTLACNQRSTGNALQMANLFYETGLFKAAEPDLLVDDLPECANDTFFNNQWGLNNTGQNGGAIGVDINACQAWETTIGDPNVIIAVLDHGIELDHPDLLNLSPLSFDTESGTSPSQILGRHGTACAGIIGATQGNSLGVSGISPGSQLMSISNSLQSSPNSRQRRADGINWAWQNGADIISNSWSSGVQYQVIDDAIDNAITQGRGGLGTIIAFSTGNGNGAVSYPANSNPDILAVGAMSQCAERKNPGSCDGETRWGSNFGNTLDIVAPGVLIPTTDLQGAAGYAAGDYTQTFNGTSSACPHVAGVAALMLSVNPSLTHREVADIIESTAQKVGTYTYQNTAGRPNGTWNNEMGYGLVDAAAAVQAADPFPFDLFLQNETVTTGPILREAINTIEAGRNVTNDIPSGDYVIAPGANITLRAGNRIRLTEGFFAQKDSYVKLQIDNTIGTSASNAKRAIAARQQEVPSINDTPTMEIPGEVNNYIRVYPNPISEQATFEYRVNGDDIVSLRLVHLSGQVTDVLDNVKLAPGLYKENLDASELAEGLYLYQFISGEKSNSGKLMIRH